jgi:hypothetical protein
VPGVRCVMACSAPLPPPPPCCQCQSVSSEQQQQTQHTQHAVPQHTGHRHRQHVIHHSLFAFLLFTTDVCLGTLPDIWTSFGGCSVTAACRHRHLRGAGEALFQCPSASRQAFRPVSGSLLIAPIQQTFRFSLKSSYFQHNSAPSTSTGTGD